MTSEEFATYLRALQNHEYATFKQYYTHYYCAHFDGATFDRDGVIEVERMLASIADSTWDVLDIVAGEHAIAVHAILEMRFKKDAPPDFALGPRKAGDLEPARRQHRLHLEKTDTERESEDEAPHAVPR